MPTSAVTAEAPAQVNPITEAAFMRVVSATISGDRAVFADPELNARFLEEDRRLTLRNVRRLCRIAMILVPLAVVLDWFTYPQLLGQFLVLRVLSTLTLVPVMWSTRTWIGERYYRALTIVVPMVPCSFINVMIYLTEDPATSYYAGLPLCLVAIGFMFHWTFRESAVAALLTLSMYLLANAPALWRGISPEQTGIFTNHSIFIILYSIVIISGSFYHHNIRAREFVNRVEVEIQREALQTKNRDLVKTLAQLRETESQLIQSEKLASLGRMSAGIIHEINNPLSYAGQALYVLRKKGKLLPEEQRDDFDRIVTDIKEGMSRVSAIISDLRSFSHPTKGAQTEVDLADVGRQMQRLMQAPLREHNVTFTIAVPAQAMVFGDRNHLIQVLVNLVQNAIDAVKTRPAPTVQVSLEEQATEVVLRVADNGCGIPAENLPRVFDPFFTTKAVGEGMGMGLSICYRLVTAMDGVIDVETSDASGTTIRLRMKRVPSSADATTT